jgi:SAM-dependent methyltransferase
MRPDSHELEMFYASRRGQLARRLITTQLRLIWPDLHGMTVVGIGYAAPFLPLFDEAERAVSLTLAGQGGPRWPEDGPSRTAFVPEEELPIQDGVADRVLLVHSLETCSNLRRFLRETWRILADGGRLLAVVPNRRGFWCWSDTTPFGHGQPYSSGQLTRTFEHHLFSATDQRGALFVPPSIARIWPHLAVPVERAGIRFVPGLAGVHLIEAEKSVLAGTPLLATKRVRGRVYAVAPQAAMTRSELHSTGPAAEPTRTAARRAARVGATSPRRASLGIGRMPE